MLHFRLHCTDLDGDGYLSMYGIDYFDEEQLQRIEKFGIRERSF